LSTAALDFRDPETVSEAFLAGAEANRGAACRRGSVDEISAPGRLIATGDIHDNPIHLAKVIAAAGMGEEGTEAPGHRGTEGRATAGPTHLTLHEIIHSDRLMNGMDFSYRALARVAALKSRYPERVHSLLGNHELAQIVGAGIVKDGVRHVDAFNAGLEYVFGGDAAVVEAAIGQFVRSMPLALRANCSDGRVILCAHSLPTPAIMQRFDPTVLSRELTSEDYEPRRGAAHLMVWGRNYDAELLEDLVERWGVNLFILGHEKAENGVRLVPPNAIILNSDHERGVYLPIDLDHAPGPEEAVGMVVPLADQPG